VTGGYYVFAGSVLGASLGPLANKFLTVKQLMVGGNFALALCLGLVSMFTILKMNQYVLAAIIVFQVVY